MEPQGDADTPTAGAPTSGTPTPETPTPGTPTPETLTPETPTRGTPTPEVPTLDTPTPGTSTSDTPTPETPTLDTSTPGTRTLDTPTSDTPPQPPAGPGDGGAVGDIGEVTAQHSGGDPQAVLGDGASGRGAAGAGGDPRAAEKGEEDAKGEAAGGGGGDASEEAPKSAGVEPGAAEGAAEGAGGSGDGARAEAVGSAGGDAGVAEGEAEGSGGASHGAREGSGEGPAAAGSARDQQEPKWLQDEEDELWPEFPPCSSPEGATSPTSPVSPVSPTSPVSPVSPMSPVSPTPSPDGTTEGSGSSKRGALAGGPRGRAPPRTAGTRPEIAGGRPRASARAQGRSAILEKFGGAATGPAPHLKRSGGPATVKAMLLEWCRARTRNYEHVDVQNFSGSWGSGLAFCALLHSFFPDAFDYGSLEPGNRRHNFALAFATAEERAGCAPLLEVDDMVRLAVPDAKCVYTYLQELYRCLVAKGLVKTKKR